MIAIFIMSLFVNLAYIIALEKCVSSHIVLNDQVVTLDWFFDIKA